MPTNTVQDRALLAGLSRFRAGVQAAIALFQGLTALGSRGQIKNVVLGTNLTGTVGPDDTLTIDATGGGGGGGFTIPLYAGNASTKFGSAQKLVLGSQYFDPSDPTYGLGPGSTATLCMLLESTSGSVNAQGELFQKSGTGSPQVIAATSTTTATTATLVTADVSAAFTDTSPAGIFCARLWTGTPNGLNQATCTGAWIEVTP